MAGPARGGRWSGRGGMSDRGRGGGYSGRGKAASNAGGSSSGSTWGGKVNGHVASKTAPKEHTHVTDNMLEPSRYYPPPNHVDQTETIHLAGKGINYPKCPHCGHWKIEECDAETWSECTALCIYCSTTDHNGKVCPRLWCSRNWWKNHYGQVPEIEENESMRPNNEVAAELIRQGYVFFKSGWTPIGQELDEAAPGDIARASRIKRMLTRKEAERHEANRVAEDQRLQEDLRLSRKENQELRNWIKKLQDKDGDLQKENGDVGKENGDVQKENGDSQRENGVSQKENGVSQKEIGDPEKEIGDLRIENAKLWNVNGQLCDVVARFRQQVYQREEDSMKEE